MYRNNETDLSYYYLEKIFNENKLDAVLIGGWATYLMVNEEFKKRNGFNYVGSRDIDIGFRLEPEWNENRLRKSGFASALNVLKHLGFIPISFRHQKCFDYDTLKMLTDADLKNKPEYEIFRLYVDVVVNVIPDSFEKTFGFIPIDEPLLDLSFYHGKEDYVYINDVRIRTIKPEVLLAMKFNSTPNRTKDDKILKDISDIYAISWYSSKKFDNLKQELFKFYSKKKVRKVVSSITDSQYDRVSEFLTIPKEEIVTVISNLSK